MDAPILVTGAAGFIGFHTARQLLDAADRRVVGIDNFDDYYDPDLKRARLQKLRTFDAFRFEELDLSNDRATRELFDRHAFDRVVHLAARPGVRSSCEYPTASVQSNIRAFLSVLEACRHADIEHLIFASSSSVYGPYDDEPLSEDQAVQHPVSLYAATKVSNEAMAHSYADLYDLPVTGLRFFTVYGPWGRPDMAYYLFADAMTNGDPIELYNHGDMRRDFTYVEDIVEGIRRVVPEAPSPDDDWSSANPEPARSRAPYRLYNIGSGEPVDLETFVSILEDELGTSAETRLRPKPPGDVESTHADVSAFAEDFDFRAKTSLREGLSAFVDWYRRYHT